MTSTTVTGSAILVELDDLKPAHIKKANQSIGAAQIFQTLLADIRAVPVQVSENKSALTAPKPNQDTT